MARLQFGQLTAAWKGEASDFTPLLAEQLDAIADVIEIDLASLGETEVQTTGGRRIDIVAQGADGSEFVIENQYGRADHDHLTRGLAYAVARRARGLIVVAEEHRDEFRAVAQYLNELAEHDRERGIAVWLIEAKAVRIEDSPWAPLFTAVVEPNSFTATVEQAKKDGALGSLEDFYAQCSTAPTREAAEEVLARWLERKGSRKRLGPNHVVLEARGPSSNGFRTVVTLFSDGQVLIPFGSYAGQNSGIPVEPLTTEEFRARADAIFGLDGTKVQARTMRGWLGPDTVDRLLHFCAEVADAYAAALEQDSS